MVLPANISPEQRAYLSLFGEDTLWVAPGTTVALPRQEVPVPTHVQSQNISPARSQTPKTVATVPEQAKPAASLDAETRARLQSVLGKATDGPEQALVDLRAEIGDCRLCALCEDRNTIVFGEGDAEARVMFVGEGPGGEEDRTGRPFVGPAGQLLTDIIVKGMKLARSETYIANIVKCRPPGNRNPAEAEIVACRTFLEQQIQIVQPEVIVVLGKVAASALLGHEGAMGQIRGTMMRYGDIPVMPTWHPSYLLRTPAKKRETWKDIQQVMALLQQNPASRGDSV